MEGTTSSKEATAHEDIPTGDTTPTLLELKTMKGADGSPLNIIKRVAAGNYTTFGVYLLQDVNGDKVEIIETDYRHKGAEAVTEAIIRYWLTSGGPTCTYQHLIKCLNESEQGALAEDIAKNLQQ